MHLCPVVGFAPTQSATNKRSEMTPTTIAFNSNAGLGRFHPNYLSVGQRFHFLSDVHFHIWNQRSSSLRPPSPPSSCSSQVPWVGLCRMNVRQRTRCNLMKVGGYISNLHRTKAISSRGNHTVIVICEEETNFSRSRPFEQQRTTMMRFSFWHSFRF